MTKKIAKFLEKYSIVNCNVIVALSGGPDSVFLLYMLNELKDDFNLTIEAAYINHGIRSYKENKKDEDLIISHCSNMNIKYHIKKYKNNEILELSKKSKLGVEATARNLRYDFFNSLLHNNDYIALGHNMDDQIETQIMRFFQGSHIEGLLGISPIRDRIIRPLFNIEKKDILDYLNTNNIKYLIDNTNNELDYLRNKIRHNLIPVVSEIFTSYKKNLNILTNNLDEINQMILMDFDDRWIKYNKNWKTDYIDFINLNEYYRTRMIYGIFNISNNNKPEGFRLPKRFLKPLYKKSFKNGEIILDGYGFRLIRENNSLIWKVKNSFLDYYFNIQISSPGEYRNSKFRFTTGCGLQIKGLKYPFSIRTYNKSVFDKHILKKINLTLNNSNVFFIENSYGVYAIICNNKVYELCKTNYTGEISISIKEL